MRLSAAVITCGALLVLPGCDSLVDIGLPNVFCPPQCEPDGQALSILPEDRELYVGEIVQYHFELEGATSGPITWTVETPEILAVVSPLDGCGDRCALLTGLSQGDTFLWLETTLHGRSYTIRDFFRVLLRPQ